MTILITGASGFVGGALAKCLFEQGRTIRTLGRTRPKVAVEFVQGSIDDRLVSRGALEGVDCVVHLAGRAHQLKDASEDPLESFRVANCKLSEALAAQAIDAGVRRFVFISSIGVNGAVTKDGQAFTALSEPEPHSPYARSKYEAEVALQALCRESSMELVVIRPPLVYGPGAPGNFASLMRWVGRGVPLPLGAIHNKRSLVGVDNLVDLIIRCIDHPAAANQVFLAGDGEDLSTTELLRQVSDAMARPGCLLPVPSSFLRLAANALGKKAMAQSLLDSLQVDISKARNLLGWEPPVSVKEGLRRCVRDSSV
ncbi:UDP-glucose 4-epimerase [Pseudomonas sp. 8Z]|uniref:UDP-glucose 4-epimerase family protein n=1 Tax=Pseudomonas sp. 8Z TaxID=2653166 RepID=UPI0012F1AB4F|nr:SDR family oxidoreductase [Pseudomonas sp. 8Z]VXC38043.1 UDP-glucose 4-epimerase [Pseudomonas sp. 8Z]